MLAGFLEGLRGLVLKKGMPESERRATPRLRCYYPVSCELGGGTVHGARVTEMSRTGMRLELAHSFPRQSKLSVTYAGPHPSPTLTCEVVWVRTRRAGLIWMGVRYQPSEEELKATWVGYVLHELGFVEQSIFEKRQHIRFPADLVAELQTPRGELLCTAIVKNLGVGGALLAIPSSLPPQSVLLSMAPLPGDNLARLDILAELLVTRPNRGHKADFLANLRFEDLNRSQVRRLGQYLLNLMKACY